MINRRIEQFKSGRFWLTGQWDEPANAGAGEKLPGVIFAHGFTGNRFESRRMYARLSAALAAGGVRTFRFDHRGCGESEGDFSEFDADGLIHDLNRALELFVANEAVDLSRTAVVGYSLGGLSASYWLSRRHEFVTGVLWAPVARPDIIRDRLATYPDFENYRERGYFDYMGFRVSADYFDNIGKLDPVAWAATYKSPLLFIQGDQDPIVNPEQAERYLAARQNPADKLLVIKGGDHAFTTADNIDRVLTASEGWLIDKLMAG